MSSAYTLDDFIAIKLGTYKSRSTLKRREFNLDFNQFKNLCLSNCFYCGLPADRGMIHVYKTNKFRVNGVDRVDNDKGYTIDNVVSSCTYCNFAKNNSTVGQLYRWAKLLIDTLDKSGMVFDEEQPDEDLLRMTKLYTKLRASAHRDIAQRKRPYNR